ncbi:MAG: hypothetical protein CO094_12905 [Anaerolineae bacterium CG_4_9_14_3_um_filter_57_17]|nr:hypothetical protein [bacterium]NCT19575.1 hypothetical protein [bacterium]OIO85280.1 MAG: hypothetical protein AUK01_06510 [Anaerolineae bacterium CG2_30_57_67]PJB64494.1 MAG: hypothetical protein CO094_12905 [Anaerolineae bacterium CG_4_9_14_3_um_filter_57_17]
METAFDDLFATQTGYEALDERIAKTRAKKTSLLLVLKHPEIPLHNNASELAVRRRVRKRDISFPGTARQGRCGPRTETGRHAWDTFMTLVETARKLNVSFYAYMRDRITGAGTIPPLAERNSGSQLAWLGPNLPCPKFLRRYPKRMVFPAKIDMAELSPMPSARFANFKGRRDAAKKFSPKWRRDNIPG